MNLVSGGHVSLLLVMAKREETNSSAAAFRSGDQALDCAARANLTRDIKGAKSDYRRRMEDHQESSNSRQVWQGVQHLTIYRST